MRILVLCDLFPLMESTRALQMSKVAAALSEYAGGSEETHEISFISPSTAAHTSFDLLWECKNSHNRDIVSYSPLWPKRNRHTFTNRIGRRSFVAWASQCVVTRVASNPPDLLMTVAVPLAWHRVGLAIKRRFPDIPWAAFFSDPRPLGWLPKPFRHRDPGNFFRARLTRKTLQAADCIVGPNRPMLDWMENQLGVDLAGRKHVIPHCGERAKTPADRDDYRGWLLHVGSLWHTQATVELFEAIQSTAEKHPADFKGLHCIGRVDRRAAALIKSLNMAPYAKVLPSVSPSEACSIIAAADVNLLTDAPLDQGYFLHSKFADYAVNGRPILVVGPPTNPMRDYIEKRGGGICVTHTRKEIEKALEALFATGEPTVKKHNAKFRSKISNLTTPFLPKTIAQAYFDVFQQTA